MPKTKSSRIPTVKRVAKRHGYLVVRHDGTDYALVPLREIERLEDAEDARDARRAEARLKRGSTRTRPFEEVCRELVSTTDPPLTR